MVWREPWDDAAFPDLSASELAAIVAKHRLQTDGEMLRSPSHGVVNSVYALGRGLVLRVPKPIPQAVGDTYTESVAVPVAVPAGVRTPRLVVFDDDHDIVSVPFTVYERVAGAPLVKVGSHPDSLAAVWRELGRDLAVLHRGVQVCPDPRHLLDDHDRVGDADVLLATAVEEGALNPDNADLLEEWLVTLRPAISDATEYRRFLHGDVQPANVMADGGRYIALIDWGDAGWGDPALDFAYLPMRALPHALAGYREVAPLDGDETAEARIWWDHLCAAVYNTRRGPAPRRDWNRPPGARLVELVAYIHAGGRIGSFQVLG